MAEMPIFNKKHFQREKFERLIGGRICCSDDTAIDGYAWSYWQKSRQEWLGKGLSPRPTRCAHAGFPILRGDPPQRPQELMAAPVRVCVRKHRP
jgi:hypothetical protein